MRAGLQDQSSSSSSGSFLRRQGAELAQSHFARHNSQRQTEEEGEC